METPTQQLPPRPELPCSPRRCLPLGTASTAQASSSPPCRCLQLRLRSAICSALLGVYPQALSSGVCSASRLRVASLLTTHWPATRPAHHARSHSTASSIIAASSSSPSAGVQLVPEMAPPWEPVSLSWLARACSRASLVAFLTCVLPVLEQLRSLCCRTFAH